MERPGTVLLVDDDRLVTLVLARCLGARYHVTVAHDGAEALALLQTGARFDVVVCDWLMPRMCGEVFVGELRRLDAAQAQRVVVITGDPGAVERSDVAQFVLEKPFTPTELRDLVERIRRAAETGYFPEPSDAS